MESTLKAAIVEEAHNKVVWEVKSTLVWIELGLFLGGLGVVAFLITVPSPLRWTLAGVFGALVLLAMAVLAATTPLGERGEFERTLDGGALYRVKRWLLVGNRLAWEAPLASIAGFRPEARIFEETDDQTYTLARLLVILTDAEPVPVTDWLDPAFVTSLAEALIRARRLAVGGD